MLDTYERHSRAKLAATFVAVLVIAGVILLADHLKSHSQPMLAQGGVGDSATPATNGTSASNSPSQSQTAPASPGSYKDGSYTASSDYSVPSGDENIRVTLMLQNGVITDSSVQNSEYDRTSAEFQQEFAATYRSYVVGKKIDTLKLGIIAGASDTTQAFNDAVGRIISKAQS
ncbi:MAG TPA: hypothetical protein VHA37_05635 [Candidatus Saccharimonadales bacterium]|nr:hypothetical protein [Candidatus Saccharimonadales bacterium]